MSRAASPASAPIDDEDAEDDPPGPDAGQPRGLGVGPGGVDRPPGREVPQAPGERREDDQRDRHDQPLAGRLPRAEPLEPRRQVADELALAQVAERLAADHQRGQGHHDRRQAQPGDQRAVDAPMPPPASERAQRRPAASAAPPAPAGRRPRRRC